MREVVGGGSGSDEVAGEAGANSAVSSFGPLHSLFICLLRSPKYFGLQHQTRPTIAIPTKAGIVSDKI